jgi:hypothetical protein
MQSDIKRMLVRQLRTGFYPQGRGALRRRVGNTDCYCIGGVLCDVVDPDGWVVTRLGLYEHRNHAIFPSRSVLKVAGLDIALFDWLMRGNDQGAPFSAMAEYVETFL